MSEHQKLARPSPLWKNAAYVSIAEAALLLLDIEPQELQAINGSRREMPEGYLAAVNALESAVGNGVIHGSIAIIEYPEDYEIPVEQRPLVNYDRSTAKMSDLRNWLVSIDHNCFLTEGLDTPIDDLKDRDHDRYSATLAAAVKAWERYDQYSDVNGLPREQIVKWLTENASDLHILKRDGQPPKKMIDKIADVVSWTKPGRPKNRP